MKRLLTVLTITAGLLPPASVLAAERIVVLDVRNMTCALCPFTVRKALEGVEGVHKVKVSFSEKTAVVTFDDAKSTIAALTTATTNAGFASSLAQEEIKQ